MKNYLSTLLACMIAVSAVVAQAPQKLSYQAVIRNASNALVVNASVGMRLSILQGSSSGTAVYVETQTGQTDANGLLSLQVGAGTPLNGSFAAIAWNNGPFFMKTETDVSGGSNYSITAVTELLSVPYALFSGNAGNGLSNGSSNGQMMYWNGSAWTLLNPGAAAQVLTMCNGVPTWTTGGVCPGGGSIASINCAGATHSGTLTAGQAAAGVTSILSYTGGNGGSYVQQSFSSTGVTGLVATLSAGSFANGSGSLQLSITGTPSAGGNALFNITIGGQSCVLSRSVNGGSSTGSSTASCGATNVHNPALTYGSMYDQDGNVYKTIMIGNREWMAENLKASHYRNGDLIPMVNGSTWSGLSTGAATWINADSATTACPFGKLFNWYAVADTRNICPSGWHVPTHNEWTALGTSLGGINVAAGKLKSTGTQYWLPPNVNATNQSGFSALGTGICDYFDGSYIYFADYAYFWASDNILPDDAWCRYVVSGPGDLYAWTQNKKNGFSVRCIKD